MDYRSFSHIYFFLEFLIKNSTSDNPFLFLFFSFLVVVCCCLLLFVVLVVLVVFFWRGETKKMEGEDFVIRSKEVMSGQLFLSPSLPLFLLLPFLLFFLFSFSTLSSLSPSPFLFSFLPSLSLLPLPFSPPPSPDYDLYLSTDGSVSSSSGYLVSYTAPPPTSLLHLPEDILHVIIGHLDYKSFCALRGVCSYFLDITTSLK